MMDILTKVEKSGLREFGCKNNLVTEYWKESVDKSENKKIGYIA